MDIAFFGVKNFAFYNNKTIFAENSTRGGMHMEFSINVC